MLEMKLGSKQRMQTRSTWLKETDQLHNCEVLERGKGGTFIPVYSTQKDKKVDDSVPCSVCHDLYKKYLLYRHVQLCGKERVTRKII